MLRVAIPIVLALVSAVVMRTLLMPLIVSVLVGILMAYLRSASKKSRSPEQPKREGDKVVDGSYKIVDDDPNK